MTPQTAWLLAIFAVLIAAVIGFLAGRRNSGRERVEELEATVERQKEELKRYKDEVAGHFDKTATLFVSMAGSYKELFEHLSSGYEQLATGSARELFQQRVDALLLGTGRAAAARPADAAAALAAAAGAAGVAGAAGLVGDEPGRVNPPASAPAPATGLDDSARLAEGAAFEAYEDALLDSAPSAGRSSDK